MDAPSLQYQWDRHGWYLCMASDPLYAEDEMELTSSEINLPHNLDEMPSRNPKESTTNMSSP